MKKLLTLLMMLILVSSVFAQVQVGTVGVKAQETYPDCAGKVFGLVGASNTVDRDPQGNKVPSSMRDIILEMCPGSTVHNYAVGGTGPAQQVSQVNKVLAHSDLNYVILDTSANSQDQLSFEQYRDAVIKLAQMVKEKNPVIEVIVLTNTPLKGAISKKPNGETYVFGTDKVVQNVKTYNRDLLNNGLGRSDLINHQVNTYSATEDPVGSDACGKYCPGGDKIHFGPAGRRATIKAILDQVFGSPTSATAVTSAPTAPATATEKCLDANRCKEIDDVWVKLTTWIAKARKGQVWDTAGGWRGYNEKYLKTTTLGTPTKPSTPTPSTTSNEVVTANTLYKNILMQLPNENLAKAMVANAKGESGMSHLASGDCGAYGESHGGIPISGKGRCCSFGLWQYNVCGGLGTTFLQAYGSPSTDESKLAIVHDYQKNIDFMISYMKKTYPSLITEPRTVDDWVAWFVREIERPSDPSGQIALRQKIARDLEQAGAFSDNLPSTPSSTPTGAATSFKNTKLEQACTAESLLCIVPAGNLGKQEAPGVGSCKPGMIQVGNFCIDQYEASLVDKNTGEPWSPYCSPQGDQINNLKAVSVAGAVPQSTVNGIQAAQACANAGKKLCNIDQWRLTCQGTEARKYPYGNTRQDGACNDEFPSRGEHVTQETVREYCPGFVSDWNNYPWMVHPKNNQQENSLDAAGSNQQCKTPEGVYDLVGNAAEWITDPEGTFLGGYYQLTQASSGSGCLFKNSFHDLAYTDYSIGFRCCASLS